MNQKILIVDDDPEIVRLIRHILESQDFEVLEAATAAAALALALQEQPSLILLDVLLPGEIDGYEVSRRLRENPQTAHQVIVMLSAQSQTADRARGLIAGADDYITKPIDVVELVTNLRDLLRQPRDGQPPTYVLTQMLHAVLAVLDAELGWLLTVDKNGSSLKPASIAAASGDEISRKYLRSVIREQDQASIPLASGTNLIGDVLLSGQALVGMSGEEIDALPGGEQLVRGMQAIEAAAINILPISLRGVKMGVFVCLFKTSKPERGVDTQLLSVTAMQVALAVENLNLLERVGQRETESRAAQRFHETLVDAMGDGLVVLDAKGAIQFVNRRLTRMLGFKKEELLGKAFYDLIRPDERAPSRQFIDETGGKTVSLEKSLLRDDGSVLPALVVHVPQSKNGGAQDFGNVLVITDLSQQQERETALLRQTRQLAAINHAAQAMAASLDLDAVPQTILEETVFVMGARGGAILLIDDESRDLIFRAVVGPQSEVLLGQCVPMGQGIVGWIAENETPVIVDDMLNDPRFYKQIDVKTGLTTYSASGAPLLFNRQLIGVLEVINKVDGKFDQDDLSVLESLALAAASAIVNARLYRDLKDHAIELEKAFGELKEADRIKDEMIQNVSHELRTPMTFILGYIEIIANGELGSVTGEQRRGLEIVRKKARSLMTIVSDIVALQRMSVDTLDRRLMEVPQVIDQAVKTVEIASRDGTYKFITDVPYDIPNVRADAERISQVLDNLLGNAIKFSPEGGIISVQARAAVNDVVFTVQDSGVGIKPENVRNVFNRFYQEDGSTTRRFGGVGLGLAICKEIVEAHGGQIWVESEPGKGTIFSFSLPRINEPAIT